MKSFTSHSLEETDVIAGTIVDLFVKRQKRSSATEALVVGLSGHLGAGKTALVKAVARHLGVQEDITSPTFVIMKLYPLQDTVWKQLVHIDAYRLEKNEELDTIGFEQLVSDPGNLILIEWPEQVQGALDGLDNHLTISCVVVDDLSRTFTLSEPEPK